MPPEMKVPAGSGRGPDARSAHGLSIKTMVPTECDTRTSRATNRTLTQSPFNDTAVTYHMRGWHPFPLWDREAPDGLQARGKKNPPAGVTGREGVNATREQIEGWRDSGRSFNIGSRMPENVIVIDIDAYHGGLETIDELESKLGSLPGTFFVCHRGDGSAHRYYRVPGKRVWKNPGKGVDILHWGWRYAVMPPSIHPDTSQAYTWYGANGSKIANQAGPRIDQLPMLPKAWRDYLDTGKDPNAKAAKVDLASVEVRELLTAWASYDGPCPHMMDALREALATTTGGRHDVCMRAQMKIIRYGEAGHSGAGTAMKALRSWFFDALGKDRDPSSEWVRGFTNATQRIAASPTPEDRKGCMEVVVLPPLDVIVIGGQA